MLQALEPIIQHPVFMAGIAALDGQYVLMLGGAIALLYNNSRNDTKAQQLERQKNFEAFTAAIDVLKLTEEERKLRDEEQKRHLEEEAIIRQELATIRMQNERILAYMGSQERASTG